jgi:SAM-dependent methyltransferase
MTNFSSHTLPLGIPSVIDYKRLLKTDLFLEMSSYSNVFLRSHAKALKKYRWVADPLHQWSRQWEYPFTYSHIRQFISVNKFMHTNNEVRILDAGSGCTFFPYYLNHKYPHCKVYCCDYDSSLSSIFYEINKRQKANVKFDVYDLTKMKYEDNFFNIIYCISVLEHACNYVDIVKQFRRVLNPHGLLIVTFDIALDNKATIDWAQGLLSELDNEFATTGSNTCKVLFAGVQKPNILTTEFAKAFDKKLLPWKLTWSSFAGQLLKLKCPKTPFHNLTVFCGVWKGRQNGNSKS